jgi:hypothetical protein
MTSKGKARAAEASANDRANQLAKAQNTYRLQMRSKGFQRLQEWLPEGTYLRLSRLCERSGLTKREAIERMVCAADEGKIELERMES